jgi:hypothetical protein
MALQAQPLYLINRQVVNGAEVCGEGFLNKHLLTALLAWNEWGRERGSLSTVNLLIKVARFIKINNVCNIKSG